ncbi:MAG TPA: tripartite tricarboxylate transporter substrate-binding protein [Alphaproteobacteria bacterium]|jgi:tripartite-type tricarboxylate transporter receptor subunit TctC|nr:tripartite tricarboxylate transporter substrate-binding protein [Alphaproteobacteria bacterium]
MRSITLFLTVAAATAAALVPPSRAADFYSGKTLTVYVTSGTGGSVDLMARLGTRHLAKHIPGRPSVVTKNKDGAGGITGANYLFNTAPRDGTEIATALMTVPFEPLYYGDRSVARFDPLKFNWIASPAKFVSIALAWHTSPIKKAEDLLTREMIVGSSGAGSASTIDSFVMRNVLGFKFRVILGYPSGSDIDLSMLRGETEGRASDAWAAITSRHYDWLRDGKIRLLYQMGLEKHPGIPADVPLGIDFAKTPEDRAVLKLRMAAFEIGYPIFAPPNTPGEVVAILRKAYDETFADPEFLADAKQAKVEVGPITGQKITEILEDAYSAPAEIKSRLIAASQPPEKLEMAKTVTSRSAISEIAAKGNSITFDADGKPAHARIAKETKVTVGGKSANASDLKVGMACEIEYYGDRGQAKQIACR